MNEEIKKPEKTKKHFPWRGVGILFSTFAVIVLLYLFYATNYYFARRINNTVPAADVQRLQNDLSSLQQTVQQLSGTVNDQTQMINTLRQAETGYNRDEWRVVEAEFMTRIAGDKLQFENNVPQAIVLLQNADQLIRDINDARLTNVRVAIAKDIAKLQAISPVDVPGLYARLIAMDDQIEKLPLMNKPVPTAPTPEVNTEHLPWWKKGLHQTWDVLRQIVIVRYNKKDELPLVLPEQQNYLYQNIHIEIQQAIWGLLHQEPAIYQASLNQAQKWIKEFFMMDAPATQAALKELSQLQGIDLKPALPDLSDSLQAFKEYITARDGRVS